LGHSKIASDPAVRSGSTIRNAWLPALVFALPLLTGLPRRLLGGSRLLDYRAVLCGAERALHGQNLYDAGAACPGAARFVYSPWVAQAGAAILRGLGTTGFGALYLSLFALSLAYLIWLALFARAAPGPTSARAPFLGFSGFSLVANGNIAVMLHAGVALTAQAFARRPKLFLAAVIAAAWVKPVFLTYLAVVALAQRPIAWRIRAICVCVVAGLLPTAIFVLAAPHQAQLWRGLVDHFVSQVTPGQGLFGWMTSLGVPTGGLAGAVCAVAWLGLITAAGAAIATAADLDQRDRIWLGLACGVLANPRLMGEDLLLVGPGAYVALSAAEAWSPLFQARARPFAIGMCLLAMLSHLVGFNPTGARLATFGIAMLLLAVAGLAVGRLAEAPEKAFA
jgi:hypothetical protein